MDSGDVASKEWLGRVAVVRWTLWVAHSQSLRLGLRSGSLARERHKIADEEETTINGIETRLRPFLAGAGVTGPGWALNDPRQPASSYGSPMATPIARPGTHFPWIEASVRSRLDLAAAWGAPHGFGVLENAAADRLGRALHGPTGRPRLLNLRGAGLACGFRLQLHWSRPAVPSACGALALALCGLEAPLRVDWCSRCTGRLLRDSPALGLLPPRGGGRTAGLGTRAPQPFSTMRRPDPSAAGAWAGSRRPGGRWLGSGLELEELRSGHALGCRPARLWAVGDPLGSRAWR